MRKADVFVICQQNKPAKRYKIYDWVRIYNEEKGTDIKINILPIAHPRLNAIELMWNWLKSWVVCNNFDFTMSSIYDLTQERKADLNGEWWEKACNKSHDFVLDCITVDDMEPLEEEDDQHDESEDYPDHVYDNVEEFEEPDKEIAAKEPDNNPCIIS